MELDGGQCFLCGACVAVCPHLAIELRTMTPIFNDECTGCGVCVSACPVGAIAGDSRTPGPLARVELGTTPERNRRLGIGVATAWTKESVIDS